MNANDFPEVYESLGIDTDNLGCLMLDTDPIIVNDIINPDDLYYADPAEHPHTQGIVSETVPHVTLLYGFMKSAHKYKDQIDTLLSGWSAEMPSIAEIGFFYTPNQPCIALVAGLELTDNLLAANQALKLLPHIDTFPSYKPHITLAYVKDSVDINQLISDLEDRLVGKTVNTIGLNYGDD